MRVLRRQRVMLSSVGADGGPQVYEARCWRYTLTIFRGSDKSVLIDGQPLPGLLDTASGNPLAGVATYVERVGGADGRDNPVDMRLEIVQDPAGTVPLLGVLVVETWTDEQG